MEQSCEIILDSIVDGVRITTIRYEIWRPLHAELMTYRQCARNASSSRAVPFTINVERVIHDPFIPRWVGKTHKGMQPDSFLDGKEYEEFVAKWKLSAWKVAFVAKELYAKGVAKSTLNRMLEPYNTINVLMTGNDAHWTHVFRQRCSKENGGQGDAERNLQDLVDGIKAAYSASSSVERSEHLPYSDDSLVGLPIDEQARICAARCARLSYTPFGQPRTDLLEDRKLAEKLRRDGHLSPFEHIVFGLKTAQSLLRSQPEPHRIGGSNAVDSSLWTLRELIESAIDAHLIG